MTTELTMYIDDNKVGDRVEETESDSPGVRVFKTPQRMATPGLMTWCEELDGEGSACPRKLRFKGEDGSEVEEITGKLLTYSLQCFLMGRITLYIQTDLCEVTTHTSV